MNKFRALVLIPPAFAGLLTGLAAWHHRPIRVTDIAQFVAVQVAIGGVTAFLLARMWRQPADRLYWGLSRAAWLLLTIAAYTVGLVLMLAA